MINFKRLLLVAKANRESPVPQSFCMSRIHTCGTPNCALGNYVARRDLQQEFQLPTEEYIDPNGISMRHIGSHNLVLRGVWGATRIAADWRQHVGDHFGLTMEKVELIFGPHGCNEAETTLDVAIYIERFVAIHSTMDPL